ncbi:MAG: cyclic nucleotide-binding domain-containing protein [Desulfobacteraceae bacterium]|nr:cyclic nucleotide-binding domain-containing protein [Desulfobacteraceae bacterium]
MIQTEQLKKILFFQGLSDKILAEIGNIADIKTYEEETELFKQNQKLSKFYMLLSGKIFLNTRTKGSSLTLDEVTPGRSFGLSALIGDTESSFAAICAEKSEVITIHNDDMLKLFENNQELGYLITLRVVQLFRSRIQKQTQQFLQSIASHPEIKKNL